jgi:hypothetical protein
MFTNKMSQPDSPTTNCSVLQQSAIVELLRGFSWYCSQIYSSSSGLELCVIEHWDEKDKADEKEQAQK